MGSVTSKSKRTWSRLRCHTGHYAQIMQLENGRYTIQNSVTATKDQTYALYNLTQNQLEHTLMPVGAYAKDEIQDCRKANIR